MRHIVRISGRFDRLWLIMAGVILMPVLLQATPSPGNGVKLGAFRLSPFADFALGYDSNVRLAQGEVLPLQPDGSYQVQDATEKHDFFSEYTIGLGVNRSLESEWDLRLRAWYEARRYVEETDSDYDSETAEISTRYWPASDKYMLLAGGKYRAAEDVERVPVSSVLTMPGEAPLPYLEEQYDQLKRQTLDGFVNLQFRVQDRTDLSVGGTASMVDYDDPRFFDYSHWDLNGEVSYLFSEKTSFFGNMQYYLAEGDGLSKKVPVYGWMLGFKTRPLERLDYRIGLGVKTYEHATDSEATQWKRKWDVNFDGLLNWHYTERMSVFGKAWTTVTPTVTEAEDTRRTYAGQLGVNYYLVRRVSVVGAVSYRLDEYDFPIVYGNNLTQEKTAIWEYTGRVTVTPEVNTFWKAFGEVSYEQGDNDLDTYDQWMIRVGASLWY